MAERGIDISGEYPKPWNPRGRPRRGRRRHHGLGDACPIFPGTRYETGISTTPPASTSTPFGPSATSWNAAYATSSPSSSSHPSADPCLTSLWDDACSRSSSAPDSSWPSSSAPVSWPARVARATPLTDAGAYVAAQVTGGIAGAVLANLMFDHPAVTWSTTERAAGHLWLGEVVATAGLVLVIFALVRAGRTAAIPVAVGAYIGAAYWFTSSTSFANPAVTVGRAFTDTFAGIAPGSVPAFVVAQLVGAGVGLALVRLLPLTTDPERRHRAREEPRMTKPSVLFVCVHNAGRSQMAAGWLRQLAGDAIEVRSAGTAPADEVNPAAVAAMAEVGIDIGAAQPAKLTDESAAVSDVIVTMGCGDECPYFPGNATRTGSSTTPPASTSTPSAPSATTSATESRSLSPNSASPERADNVGGGTVKEQPVSITRRKNPAPQPGGSVPT